jgi:hypothetical protein
MASLNFDEADLTEALLMQMEAKIKRKNLKDQTGDLQRTNYFISELSPQSINKVISLLRPLKINETKFDDIQKSILDHVKPRKRCIIAERAKFMNTKQQDQETLISYLNRLKDTSQFCDFDKLTAATAENEMIIMRLVDGLKSGPVKQKILENIQMLPSTTVTLDYVVQLAQQFEMLNVPVPQNTGFSSIARVEKSSNSNAFIDNCQYCGGSHPKNKCPSYGKSCKNCGKLNHFAKVCRAKNVKEITAETEPDADIFHISGNGGPTVQQMKINDTAVNMLYRKRLYHYK